MAAGFEQAAPLDQPAQGFGAGGKARDPERFGEGDFAGEVVSEGLGRLWPKRKVWFERFFQSRLSERVRNAMVSWPWLIWAGMFVILAADLVQAWRTREAENKPAQPAPTPPGPAVESPEVALVAPPAVKGGK
jgi:hypothetical protein